MGKLREMNRAYAYALFLLCAATAIVSPAQISPLAIGGSGTTNYIPIWTNSTTLGYQFDATSFRTSHDATKIPTTPSAVKARPLALRH